jgi:serine-type D-Ala-D-Ala carboxypeptidase/endopeptidase (penicillin-binding protein 4)
VSVAGRAQLKTGSLTGVAAIAGLVHGANGQRWAVVAIVNHPNAGRDGTRQVLDGVLGWAGDLAP